MKYTFCKVINIAVLFAAFASCSEKKQNTTTEEAIVVKTAPIIVEDYATARQYSGKIESAGEANLSFKVGGIISRMYVKEGDAVKGGQLLATLDLTEINAQVQQATQGAAKAARDFTRMKNLLADTAATLEQYQNAETGQKVAEEAVRIATFNQQYAQIRATGAGTIIKKMMNEGEFASPGVPVLLLNATTNDDWVMRFGVSDKDWASLKKGDMAAVKVDAYPAETFKGVVTKIAGAADVASGTYEVEVKVLPGDKKFAAGLFATIELRTAQQQKVAMIPIEAFTEGDGKTGYVYLLNGDGKTVTKRKVTIAFVDNDKVAINGGLDNVSSVITDGVSYLTADATVKLATDNAK